MKKMMVSVFGLFLLTVSMNVYGQAFFHQTFEINRLSDVWHFEYDSDCDRRDEFIRNETNPIPNAAPGSVDSFKNRARAEYARRVSEECPASASCDDKNEGFRLGQKLAWEAIRTKCAGRPIPTVALLPEPCSNSEWAECENQFRRVTGAYCPLNRLDVLYRDGLSACASAFGN